jgi:hypothetical protein
VTVALVAQLLVLAFEFENHADAGEVSPASSSWAMRWIRSMSSAL